MRRRRAVPVVLALCATLLAACGGGDGVGSQAAASGGGTGTIKIGAIFSQQGPLASYGQPGLAGVQMAVDEINKQGIDVGGTKYTFEVVARDDRSDPSVAASSATELIRDEEVKIIAGPSVGTLAGPVAQLTMPAQVIQLTPTNVVEQFLTPDTVNGSAKTLFHTLIDNATIGKYFHEGFAQLEPQAKTFAVLSEDNAAFNLTSATVRDTLVANGYVLTDDIRFDKATTDFNAFLTQIKAKSPDLLYVGGSGQSPTTIIKQASQLDAAKIFGATNLNPRIALSDAIGSPIPQDFYVVYNSRQAVAPTSPESTAFFAELTTRLGGKLPDLANTALWYYDYLFMLADAMKQAGSVDDTDAIATALATVTRKGVLGSDIRFNPVHTALHGIDAGLVKNGAFQAIPVS